MEDSDNMAGNIEGLKKFEELLDGKKNPTRQELFELIDNGEFSEEVKENLRELLRGNTPQVFGSGSLMAVVLVLVILSIILFFGYKLYKSIKEKELKKEEKKKAKQLKKKK